MEINIAKSAGFCFGVRRAVETVYKESVKKNVYTYGPIIHNDEVVKDLEQKGVTVIKNLDELSSLEGFKDKKISFVMFSLSFPA